jgi:hypothetical protein
VLQHIVLIDILPCQRKHAKFTCYIGHNFKNNVALSSIICVHIMASKWTIFFHPIALSRCFRVLLQNLSYVFFIWWSRIECSKLSDDSIEKLEVMFLLLGVYAFFILNDSLIYFEMLKNPKVGAKRCCMPACRRSARRPWGLRCRSLSSSHGHITQSLS